MNTKVGFGVDLDTADSDYPCYREEYLRDKDALACLWMLKNYPRGGAPFGSLRNSISLICGLRQSSAQLSTALQARLQNALMRAESLSHELPNDISRRTAREGFRGLFVLVEFSGGPNIGADDLDPDILAEAESNAREFAKALWPAAHYEAEARKLVRAKGFNRAN